MAKENYILGISCYYHDSAACLIEDGVIVAAAEEERFTREKHDSSFPVNAINFCLAKAGITAKQLSYVAFYEKPLLKFERILSTFARTFPKSFWYFYKAVPSWMNEKLRIEKIISKKLKYEGNVLFVPHHLSHAASAFLVSPFDDAAIITCDGVGEWATTTIGLGKGNAVKLLKEIDFPDSLGLLYSTFTAYLGFEVNNDEYKVMGLAAYGKPRYHDAFRKIIDIKDDGSFKLDMRYFSYEHRQRMFSKEMIKLLGAPRKKDEKITSRHQDIAATLQKITEEIMIKTANHAYKITGSKNLCLAGGVALNCVANGKLLSNTKFKRLFIQPAAGDSGGAIGAAFYVYNSILKNKRNYAMDDAYLGTEFSDAEIKDFLDKNKIKYELLEEDELLKKVAKLIHQDKVVGWFQGRMEFGPRALGSRSILANPCNPRMKDILNRKVKHREEFRPFAPAVLADKAQEFFEMGRSPESPFMLQTFNVRKDKQKILPSITHVDGTARVQTVTRAQNKRFYDLIKEFGALSGVPVIINTSFNVRGQPIVNTPKDAYDCFRNTEIDCLVIGNCLVRK
ncbi:MAG: carbamoyltransferase [archaeon]